jgi:hypothetical protein
VPDINRKPNDQSVHNVHLHRCQNCNRNWSCNCAAQPDKLSLTCRDCETGTYNPVIHGGTGTKAEA